MKKILLLTLEAPPIFGGISVYVNCMANYLNGEVAVFTTPFKKNIAFDNDFDQNVQKYKIIRKELLWPKFVWPRWVLAFIKIFMYCRENKPSLIITPHILPLGYVVFLISLLFKIPYIINLHGLDIKLFKKSRWKKFWAKKILRKSKGIIANSEFTKKEIETIYDFKQQNVVIAYPCPDKKYDVDKNFIEKIKNKFAINSKHVILSVGRLINRKGFDRVLEVLPQIIQSFPDIVYIIAGEGPELNNLAEKTAELQIQNHVRIIGAVAQAQKAALFEICSIFIMPLRESDDVEGFGIVYLEAALHGKPSVACNFGGAGEAVVDGVTGILCGTSNNDLKDVIVTILKDENLKKELGINAKQRVNSEFIWEKQIEKINRLIGSI